MIGWAPYWKADNVTYVVCGAHLHREFEGVWENAPDHTKAQEFAALLFRMKAQKERDKAYKKNAGTYHQHKFFK